MRSISPNFRRALMLLPLIAVLAAVVPVATGVHFSTAAWAQDPPPASPPASPPKVDVTVQTTREVWYTQPMWIGVGACILILLVALIVAGSRSGGTTVIK